MTGLRTNDDYDHLFDYYGQVYNVDPLLGKTVFHLESSGNPGTKDSPAGAGGGMQIMSKLADHYGIDRRDMTQAIPAAMAYLAEGLQATGGDPGGALAYYNGGPATLQRWKPETQGYVSKALSYYPQIQLKQYADAGGAAPPGKTATDASPSADAPDESAFRSRWGIGGIAPASPDEQSFRARWGIGGDTPAATAVPTTPAPRPITASDSAASSADRLPPPPDSALTSAQIAESRARIAQSPYASLEPSEPGFAHLMWSMGAPFMNLGETALGYKPAPTGVNALAAAAPVAGVGDLRFGGPLSAPPPGASVQNPLASPRAAAGAPPTFGPAAGRTFDVDAQGNVTSGQLPVPVDSGRAATPNPLASEVAVQPGSMPMNPLATGTRPASARGDSARSVVPARTSLAPTPANDLIAASIKARTPPLSLESPAPSFGPQPGRTINVDEQGNPIPPGGNPPAGGPVPPGWSSWNPSASGYTGAPPPGAPPPNVPGYTPTTPGVTPQAAAGLSPAEIAAYASMHDTPPPAPMIPPQTKAAAEKLADQVIRYFHTGNPPRDAANLVVPPGYHPTLVGIHDDPGLATLLRGVESVSGTPSVIAQHNARAINEAAKQLVGEPGDANAMETQVKSVTGPMFKNAFANKSDMDPTMVRAATDAADKILAGKIQNRPGALKVIQQVRDSLGKTSDRSVPETDPEMMHGALQGINDSLSPLSQSTDADKAAASSALMQIKPFVQRAIESGASGFKVANDTHATQMKPVDAQRFLEGLNLTNATGDVRLAAVDSAIKNIRKQQAAPGISKAEWVTPDQMNQLTALLNALRMEASRGTGKPINSTTFQNMATNSKVSQLAGNPLAAQVAGNLSTGGLGGIGVGHAINMAVTKANARSEQMFRDALIERLLNFSGKGEATLAGNPTLAGGPRAGSPGPGTPSNPLSSGPTHGVP